MDLNYTQKQLTVLEYPGTVQSVKNMTRTLGGEEQLFSAFNNPAKRLELKFRPNDPFCKCAHGDRYNTTNLLIKVVKKVKKRTQNNSDPVAEPKFSVEFMGVACTTYKFKSLCDFQMLPLTFDKSQNSFRSLLPDIIPETLHPASWLDQKTELFIPPVLFSRFDLPQAAYADSVNKILDVDRDAELPANVIGRGRKRRAGYAIFATFENGPTCDAAQPIAVARLEKYSIDVEFKNKLVEAFQERPIFSKNCLVYKLKCDRSRLKYSLPCTGYYFTNGPWRSVWVRFGYDPRKDKASKIYQILDVRVNPTIPINAKKSRAPNYLLPNKYASKQYFPSILDPQFLMPTEEELGENDLDNEEDIKLSCEYWPGCLPQARQMFYQLCDIHMPEVQQLIHANDGRENVCLEKDGWLEPGTLDRCREIVLADIAKTAELNKPLDTV